MLILKAFPFSFAILWRYILVLPLLLITLALFGVVAFICAFIFGLFDPFLALLFVMAFAVASSIIPVMVGTRVGLQAKEMRPTNSYLGLMKPGLIYGFFEGFCLLAILAASIALILATTSLRVDDFMALGATGDAMIANYIFGANPLIVGACFVIGGVLTVSLRAALLVPMAAASVGFDPDGRSHTPFFGVGGAFWTNVVLVILSYVGSGLVFPLVAFALAPFGITGRFMFNLATMGPLDEASDLLALGVDGAVFLALTLVLTLWFLSLQCAGAVLYFDGERKAYRNARGEKEKEIKEVLEKPPMPETDLRELMRSRMPKKNDQ
ncbi:MAG: hypothetical protein ACSHW1_07520 [Yoonia sp.]|uniref:hypothetical protein n=1 Tax=Yoonia sp. TaxID=2212373 RepID=UPI003EF2E9B2